AMAQSETETRAWMRGRSVQAGTALLLAGIFQVLMGVNAIARSTFFVSVSHYLYSASLRTWGWVLVGVGAAAILTALWLFTGMLLARMVGFAVAVLAAVAGFFFIPYYPIWSILIVATYIWAIWAISTSGRGAAMARADSAARYGGDQYQTGER